MENVPAQNRSDWDASIHDLSLHQPLHVHTLILPPGVRPDDPRLKQGKVVNETSYFTDKISFPNWKFMGNIHKDLPVNPVGDRLVLSPQSANDNAANDVQDSKLESSQDQSKVVDTTAPDIGSGLTRSNVPFKMEPHSPNVLSAYQSDDPCNAYYFNRLYYDSNCDTCRQIYSSDPQFVYPPNSGNRVNPTKTTIQNPIAFVGQTGRHSEISTDTPVAFRYQKIEIPKNYQHCRPTKVLYTTKEIPSETTATFEDKWIRKRDVNLPTTRPNGIETKQWVRLAEDRNPLAGGTYILNQGHELGHMPTKSVPIHAWDNDRTIGAPTSHLQFNETSRRENATRYRYESPEPPRESWKEWLFRKRSREKKRSTFLEDPGFLNSYGGYTGQSRADWEQTVDQLCDKQPLHIHTVILPPGVSLGDPRLRKARIVSQNTFWTDRPIYPDGPFLGNIRDDLPACPTGPRLVY